MELYFQCKKCERKILIESVAHGALIKFDGLEIACKNCGEEYKIFVKSTSDEEVNKNRSGRNFLESIKPSPPGVLYIDFETLQKRKERSKGANNSSGEWSVPDPNYIYKTRALIERDNNKSAEKFRGGTKGGGLLTE
jgi:hypothetical protein